MTKEALEAEANRMITGAKYHLESRDQIQPMFRVHDSQGWRDFTMPPGTEVLLNSGDAKKLIFNFFRDYVRITGADGVIFLTDAWAAVTTPEGMKHVDTPEWQALQDSGFVSLIQRGWVTRQEVIAVTAQMETEVLVVQQAYQRQGRAIQLLQAKRYWVPQSDFGGRQKVFGDLSEQNLGERGSHPRPV